MRQEIHDCIQACFDCHRVCYDIAAMRVIGGGTGSHRATPFRDALNCAELSLLTAHFLLSDSSLSIKVCTLCAEACDLCAGDCERLGGLSECLRACRRCGEACRKVVAASQP